MRLLVLTALLAATAANASAAGQAQERYAMALKLRNGAGVPANAALAHVLVRQAAESGHVPAMFTLSNMLAQGEGAAADRVASQRWLRVAAERDYPEALQQLAMEEPDQTKSAQLMRAAGHALKHRRADAAGDHHHGH